MRSAINFNLRRLLTFRPPLDNTELCADCRHDLETYKSAEPPPNARFWRGYFVRTGEGYQILTLPGFIYVHFGELADLGPGKLAEARRGAITSVTGRGNSNINAAATLPDGAEAIARFISREIEEDPLRHVAQLLLEDCIALAENLRTTDPEQARGIVSDTLVGAAAAFPELQTRMKALRDLLEKPAGTASTEAPGGVPASQPKA
jgi:hypothetical protein